MKIKNCCATVIFACSCATAQLYAENNGNSESCAFVRGEGKTTFKTLTSTTHSLTITPGDGKPDPDVQTGDFLIEYTTEEAKNDKCEATYTTHGKVKFIGNLYAFTGSASSFNGGHIKAVAYAIGTVDGEVKTSPTGVASEMQDQISDIKVSFNVAKGVTLDFTIKPQGGGVSESPITGLADIVKTGDHHPKQPITLSSSVTIQAGSQASSDTVDGIAQARTRLVASNATTTPITFNPK